MIAITAASGQLGRLVLDQLLQTVPSNQVLAVVRNPAKALALEARGVALREASYDNPEALARAFSGVEKLLLISSSELGKRARQHKNVIDAAKHAGVKLIVYTSLLRADTTPLDLGPEHLETERGIQASGIPFILLRNGWYHENYTAGIPAALAHGSLPGAAGTGRIASASRADYAAAAVAALTGSAIVGRTYELAGDTSYTLSDLAAEISVQTGKHIPYVDLPEAEYAAILLKAGLPPALAHGLASWDAAAARGALFDEGHELARLIGRPCTSIAQAVGAALKARG